MNWLQKIANPLSYIPQSYLGVGHEDEEEIGIVIIWKYHKGIIIDEERSFEIEGHIDIPGDWTACGRIEVDNGIGSISFNNEGSLHYRLKQKIINTVINKYPGINFFVYPDSTPALGVQKYWEMLGSGQI
ncbi:MAG: hypothetical protein ACXAC2_24770 [Candidatus Kariarchaeaceae archaeon]|jgi:hypothetical protein